MLEKVLKEFEDKRIKSLIGIKEGTLVSCLLGSNYYIVSEAKVHWQGDRVFLCQNAADGARCSDRLGYKYSWTCGDGSESDLISEQIGNAHVFEYSTEIEELLKLIQEEKEKELEKRRIEEEKRKEAERKKQLKQIEESKPLFVSNVLKYIKYNRSTPLFFTKDSKKLDLNENQDEEVERVLELTVGSGVYKPYMDYYNKLKGINKLVYMAYILSRSYYSNSEKFGYETRYGARRSSIDIWRHLLTIDPNLSIFDVIDSLWKLSSDPDSRLGCSFCSGVKRMVFYFGGTSIDKHTFNYKDEYNNYLVHWKYAKKLYKDYLKEQENEESSEV